MCFFPAIGVTFLLGIPCPDKPLFPFPPLPPLPNPEVQLLPQSLDKIERRAREVTVRVISDKNAASGILIDKQKSTYFVITNRHVLQGASSSSIKVVTFDGKAHSAALVSELDFQSLDLAMLSFQSSATYAAARLGKSQDLQIGDWVFSTGFPKRSQAWKFAEGQYILNTPKPMQYGYAFGYSSGVEKGMSGGAVMDVYGRVVAINGVHAHPIWGKPTYRYVNGEKPCEPMQEAITNLSWSIPMETVVQFVPHLRLTPLEMVNNIDFQQSIPNPFAFNHPLPSLLQKRAKLLSECVMPNF